MIKMVNGFKLTVVHFARPNPMQIRGCTWNYHWTKKLWKIRTGPLGHGAVTGRGPQAAGPLGSWAAGPLRPWAAGCWAAGLLLAKPWISIIHLL